MSQILTDYERFEQSSARNRALLCEEELILDVTEAISEVMQKEGITKAQLAKRMGRTKGFITQLLSGDRNLTLRTLAGVVDALECRALITVSKDPLRISAGDQILDSRVIEPGWQDHPAWNHLLPEKGDPARLPPQALSDEPLDELLLEAA